jgi:hypothetical protein
MTDAPWREGCFEDGVLTALINVITFGVRGTHAVTIGGWTPGLRALLAGQVLPCGCLAGTYQTAGGDAVAIVDTAADSCGHHHDTHRVLWRHAARAVPRPIPAATPQRSTL